MKASDYVMSFLEAQGVEHIFEVVGGMITHLVDSASRPGFGKINLVSVHHEQSAAFAADAAGRLQQVPGVAMATSGPGATNLLTGIASCYFDSSPAIFITGQVNRAEQKGSSGVRQLGFQETDIVSMAKPVTKGAWRIESASELPERLVEAYTLALSGRPGPVLLDIPMDVQRENIEAGVEKVKLNFAQGATDYTGLFHELRKAKRPLILAGGGIRAAYSIDRFRKFIDLLNIPVVTSLMAIDAIPYAHPLRVGFLGSYGNRFTNLAISKSDFLLVLGSRLDVRQTGSETKVFKTGRVIYHVDCDPSELNNRVTGCQEIVSELSFFLDEVFRQYFTETFEDRKSWKAEIGSLKTEYPDTDECKNTTGINPNRLIHNLSRSAAQAALFVTDVGQHQMWAAQSLELKENQRFMTSGGLGAMGFGLPAAIGASFMLPKQAIVLIAGDGGFQLNIQELQTVVRHQLPIKMILLNNHCHGMVRQFQQSYFNEKYEATLWGYSAPQFSRVAAAYGIDSFSITKESQVSDAFKLMWKDPLTPFFLEVEIDTFANVYPKIAFGRPISDMEPFERPLGMEGT